jgi:hypothetical protein
VIAQVPLVFVQCNRHDAPIAQLTIQLVVWSHVVSQVALIAQLMLAVPAWTVAVQVVLPPVHVWVTGLPLEVSAQLQPLEQSCVNGCEPETLSLQQDAQLIWHDCPHWPFARSGAGTLRSLAGAAWSAAVAASPGPGAPSVSAGGTPPSSSTERQQKLSE